MMPRRVRDAGCKGLAALLAAGLPVAAQAQGFGGPLRSIAPADFHPAGSGDSIAQPTIRSQGVPGLPETSVRSAPGMQQTFVMVQANSGPLVLLQSTTSVTASNSVTWTVRSPAGAVPPISTAGSVPAVILSQQISR